MKTYTVELLLILVGACTFAFGINYFIIPNQLSEGGITGLTVIFHYLSGLSPALINFALNILIFAFTVKYLSRQGIIYTLVAIFISSVALFFTDGLGIVFTQDMLLAAIFAGLFVGAGIGLIFRAGGTMGGTSIIAQVVHRYLGISVAHAMLIIDVVVVLASIPVIGFERGLYTFIAVYVGAKAIDVIIKGRDEKVAVNIISTEEKKILDKVLTTMSRGITVLEAKGGFSKEKKEVLYLVINKYELPMLKSIISDIDKNAYVTIFNVTEIIGRGYKASKKTKAH